MIELTPAQVEAIGTAAAAAFPAEACGLLVGSGRRLVRVERVVMADNLLRDQAPDRFELDPTVRFAVERAVRGGPERIVGHWHSHPNGRSLPSSTDLSLAWEPEMIWLIAAVHPDDCGRPRLTDLAAHRLDATRRRHWPIGIRIRQNKTCKPDPFPT